MGESVLRDEELMLGGVFAEGGAGPLTGARAYAGESGSRPSAWLCDLSGMAAVAVRGDRADALVGTALAGRHLSVGECSFQPALMGDGALVSVALVARTGEGEYCLWDPSPRGELLASWLGLLSRVEQGGARPYEGVSVEPMTDGLVPLLLWGEGAKGVLADYLQDGASLPGRGHVGGVALDGRIPALVLAPPVAGGALLALAQPGQVRLLWRSLLSFQALAPAGTDALLDELRGRLPWYAALEGPERLVPDRGTLRGWGIMRREPDFVGARALAW